MRGSFLRCESTPAWHGEHDCYDNNKCITGGCSNGLNECQGPNNTVACVDFETSPLHCGDCNQACQYDEICVQGNCHRYAPAYTCSACPCDAVCAALFDNQHQCCAVTGYSTPVCVSGGSCP